MLPIDVIKLDHVAMATWDARGTVRLLTEVLGGRFVGGGDEHGPGFRWLQFELGGGKVEILEPLHTDGFLYRFLVRRGEGLHHVTLYVEDLERAIGQAREAGYEPVDVNLAHESWKEAFLHPKQTNGVMIQLAQTSDPWGEPGPGERELEDFLADRPGVSAP